MRALAAAFAASLASRLAQFRDDRRGVSALEFAITLPLMLGLYLGSADVTQGIGVKRKVTLIARTLADLSSQYTAIDSSDMSNIFNAGSAIIVPYPAAPLQETVSEISINSSGTASVVWSNTSNGTALTAGASVSTCTTNNPAMPAPGVAPCLPSALAVAGTSLILGQVYYNYNPNYGYVLTSTLTLSDQFFMRPRQSNSISYTGS
jgi:Flp pilus assembly protein TadG